VKTESGTLFIVSGPSGIGKTTVVTEFLKEHGHHYKISRAVTYTTKKPRVTEVHGTDYHFISQPEFERKVQDGFFLEWSGEYGACYGTPMQVIDDLKCGNSFILVIDRVGAAQIVAKHPDVVLIWITISSMEVLLERLSSRKTDSLEQIQVRMGLAKKEIEQEKHLPMYHYHIANNDLKHALDAISEVVLPRIFIVQKDII
jgi:guanylate kinase